MIEGDNVGHGRGSRDGVGRGFAGMEVGRGELGRGVDGAWLMGLMVIGLGWRFVDGLFMGLARFRV